MLNSYFVLGFSIGAVYIIISKIAFLLILETDDLISDGYKVLWRKIKRKQQGWGQVDG